MSLKKIKTVDMHTGGEPLRIITGGLPELKGKTLLEKRRYFREHLDTIRTGLMWEPRGHADMYGVAITGPDDEGADFGAIFLHNEGYSTMCGHATLALARFAADRGWVSPKGDRVEMKIDVSAGRLSASAIYEDGHYVGSSFVNVPSFVSLLDATVDIPGVGKVRFDIAYGGAFYAFVDAESFGLDIVPANSRIFGDLGWKIKQAVAEQFPVSHPYEEELSFLYGVIFTGPAQRISHHSRNVCIFADGELDRSATGSGVSARAALHHARGELKPGESITIESILGTTMEVEIMETTTFGPYNAVIPEVSGKAFYTGEHEFVFEDEDPLAAGFLLR
jgi:trans-L-3-hydroxyproline dehydratase